MRLCLFDWNKLLLLLFYTVNITLQVSETRKKPTGKKYLSDRRSKYYAVFIKTVVSHICH